MLCNKLVLAAPYTYTYTYTYTDSYRRLSGAGGQRTDGARTCHRWVPGETKSKNSASCIPVCRCKAPNTWATPARCRRPKLRSSKKAYK